MKTTNRIIRSLILLLTVQLGSGTLSGQERLATSRPFNSFNLRNFRFNFSMPAARPLGMGGGVIALPDDPSAAVVNPAGLGLFARPAIASSTRLNHFVYEEPSYGCAEGVLEVEERETFMDQTLISAIVVYKSIHFSTFREALHDSRFSLEARRPLRTTPGQPVETLLQTNFPSRAVSARLQIVDNGSSLGWRFSKWLNLGATLRLTRLEYRLTERQYYNSNLSPADPPGCAVSELQTDNIYLIQNIDERQWGVGVTLGALSRLSNRLVLGLVYNYRPRFELSSRIFLPRFVAQRGDSSVVFPAREDSLRKIRLDLPDSYGIGLAYKYRGWMNITLDILRVENAQLAEDRKTHNLIQNDPPGAAENSGENPDLVLSDNWEVHLGLEYLFKLFSEKRRFPARFGYYYRPNNIPYAREEVFREAFPKASGQHHVTGGLGIFWGDRLRLDGAIDLSGSSLVLMGSSVYVF